MFRNALLPVCVRRARLVSVFDGVLYISRLLLVLLFLPLLFSPSRRRLGRKRSPFPPPFSLSSISLVAPAATLAPARIILSRRSPPRLLASTAKSIIMMMMISASVSLSTTPSAALLPLSVSRPRPRPRPRILALPTRPSHDDDEMMMCDEFDWSWRASFFVVRYSKGGRSLSFFLCLLLLGKVKRGVVRVLLFRRKESNTKRSSTRDKALRDESKVSLFSRVFF